MLRRLRARVPLEAMVAVAMLAHACGGGGGGHDEVGRVLVFSRTTGFRHPSIEPGVAAIRELGDENGFAVDHTEDPAVFSEASLAGYRVVVFLSTTGDPISDPDQRSALEDFVHRGGGYVGIHAASDQDEGSRTTWPWYGRLLGAYFGGHPLYNARPSGDESCALATITSCHDGIAAVEDRVHPSTRHLVEGPAGAAGTWAVYDEFYGFDTNPRPSVHVLLTLDESTYLDDPRRVEFGPGLMGEDHPIAWCHEFEGGRAFYTGLGHDVLLFQNDAYLRHVLGGILWAAGAAAGDCRP